jgi:hypothetical protein
MHGFPKLCENARDHRPQAPPDFTSGFAMICFTPAMHSRLAAFTMTAVLALAPAAFAGGKKEAKSTVSFHIETAGTDNPKMIVPHAIGGQQRYFMRSPEIDSKEMESFAPFPSDVPEQYGIVFKVKPAAVGRLAAVTNVNQGRWMIAQLNGRIIDGVIIDKQIGDGRLVVWSGVTLQDIALLDQQYPRTGESGKKKK